MRSAWPKFCLMLALAFVCAIAIPAKAQIDPNLQIGWPSNCSTGNGMVYNPFSNTCINMNAISPSSQITWPAICNTGAGYVYNFNTNTCINMNAINPSSQVTWPAICNTGAGYVYNFNTNTCINMNAINPSSQVTWPATCSNPGYVYSFFLQACIPNGNVSLTPSAIQYATSGGTTRATLVADLIALWAGGSCTGYLFSDGSCSTPAGTVPPLTQQGQAPIYSPNGTVAGNPTANSVTPDALQQQGPQYNTQAGTIASVTDANAKAALNGMDSALLNLQNTLEQAGIFFPNSLQTTIASAANAVFVLLNPTGSATPSLSVNNILSLSDTWTATPGTGQANFLQGGKGIGQGGWVRQGVLGNGPNSTPSGPVLSSVSGASTISTGATSITSTGQVQGGGSLTNYGWAPYVDTSTSHLTFYNVAGGASICWWGSMEGQTNSNGSVAGTGFAEMFRKPNEWQLGPGFGGVYNGSAFQNYGFPTSSTSNTLFWFGVNGSNHYQPPLSFFQMCLVYNPSAGSYGGFTVYMNDGTGVNNSGQILLTSALSATSASGGRIEGSGRPEGFLYLPGTQLTQQQIAGMYYGFTTAVNPNPLAMARNAGPTFTGAPGVQWNTHTITAADVQDCPYFAAFANGGNSSGALGNLPYIGTWSQCHVKFNSSASVIRIGFAPGQVSLGFSADVAVRIDGLLASFELVQSGLYNLYIEAIPGTTNTQHTYDVSIGVVGGGSGGYTPANLYSGFAGIFLQSISVPNPYNVSTVPESGTVALCVTDSILCSGYAASVNGTGSQSAIGSFLPLERYSTGTTSFNTANIAALGAGSFLLSTDFNPTGVTSGSVPTAGATTYVTNYVVPLTGGTSTNAAVNIVGRGINDFVHGAAAFGGGANCSGIFAFALKNELAAMANYNSLIHHYVMAPINYANYNETAADGCSGDSYTTVNTLNVYEYSGGVWTSTLVNSGTNFSGSSQLFVYRAIEADICASTANCTYVELGPGGQANANGTLPPTLQASAGQCYNTTQVCFVSDQLHLSAYGHFVLTRYVNSMSWATSQTLKQFALDQLIKSLVSEMERVL